MHPIEKPAILVLEDDLLLAMDMEDHLHESGCEVVGPFGRLSEALDAVTDSTLAGAVVDLNVDGELSFPVIEALQAKSIPVIVCTGYAELPEIRARLNRLPLLPKPWNTQSLARLMRDVFGIEARQ